MLVEFRRNVNWKGTNVLSFVVIVQCGGYFPRFQLSGRHEPRQAASTRISTHPRMSQVCLQLRALAGSQRDGLQVGSCPLYPFNGQRCRSAVCDCDHGCCVCALGSRGFGRSARAASSQRWCYPGEHGEKSHTYRCEQAEWNYRLASYHHRAHTAIVSNISSTKVKPQSLGAVGVFAQRAATARGFRQPPFGPDR